jgi:hypothetical protein
MVTHRPPDDLSRSQIEHRRQLEPAFSGGDIGDIRQPNPIRRRRYELLREQIRGDR